MSDAVDSEIVVFNLAGNFDLLPDLPMKETVFVAVHLIPGDPRRPQVKALAPEVFRNSGCLGYFMNISIIEKKFIADPVSKPVNPQCALVP